MKQFNHPILMLLMMALFAGCASMSKKECLSADWETVGYRDGARGVHYTYLEKHRESCVKYEVIPDDAAYRNGWEQGIRSYCTADNGYRAGTAGRAYRNICPADVAGDFLAGWEQGIEQFCTPENGLQHGLSGRQYSGVCPPHLEPGYRDFYRLGHDVRSARTEHHGIERQVQDLERRVAAEKDLQRHRNMLHELERLQHAEARSDARLIALEACMNYDWFDAGYRDGEDGYSRRAPEIAAVCRNYGIGADFAGYREGWFQGNRHYCTYENGLYLGQTNQLYSGVCAGGWHQRFWQGYEQGRHIYREGRYAAHPRPAKRVIKAPETHLKAKPVHAAPKRPVRQSVERERKERPQPVAEKERRELKRDIRQPVTQPSHDNRDKLQQEVPGKNRQDGLMRTTSEQNEKTRKESKREIRQPVIKQQPVIRQPHDNRDKLMQALPGKSRKDESKRMKSEQDEQERGKENSNGNIREDEGRLKQSDTQLMKK